MSGGALRLHCSPGGVGGTLSMPGSKSYTNRALVMAALADGESRLIGASESDDSQALSSALERLGVRIEREQGGLRVLGHAGVLASYRGSIDVGAAGTSMRFLVPLCAFVPNGDIELRGSARMHVRPIGDLVEALRSLGADISYSGKSGCPPLRIRGTPPLCGGPIRLHAGVSSQFVSALLMASPLFDGGLEVTIEGDLISKSYVEMTIQSMRSFGVRVESSEGFYRVERGQRYAAGAHMIEGDASGASYPWALAAVSGGRVVVRNIGSDSLQGDARFPSLLEHMGCSISSGSDGAVPWIAVAGSPAGSLRSIETDMSMMPDTAQTLAVVAAFADGRSILHGLSTLRHKETDRLAATVRELGKAGIEAGCLGDTLWIQGGRPHAASISTYDDHRMAMAFSVLAARVDGIVIEDAGVVSKSFPEYWRFIEQIGVRTT